MKFKSLLTVAALSALALSSCSKDEVAVVDNSKVTEGYATFKINLPSQAGSRAATYEQGESYEYIVKDAKLLIFKQSNTNASNPIQFQEAVDLGDGNPWEGETPMVKASATVTAVISNVDVDKYNYYAVALLNPVEANIPATNATYEQWVQLGQNQDAFKQSTTDGFYMSNAVYANNDGSIVNYVKLDPTKIGKDKAEAESKGIAAEIYVERAHAKATIAESSFVEKNVVSAVYPNDKATITNWCLDITNKTGFPVLNTQHPNGSANIESLINASATQTGRFVNSYGGGIKLVSWAIDPNYNMASGVTTTGNYNYVTKDDVIADKDGIQYCLENTTEAEYMLKKCATRVVFKANYVPDGMTEGTTFYKIKKTAKLYTFAQITQKIAEKAKELLSTDGTEVFAVSGLGFLGGGRHTFGEFEILKDTRPVSEAEQLQVAVALGLENLTDKNFYVYENGVSYYATYIRHFQDSELTESDVLGKYGVARNNWYELTVNNITGPGEPDVPVGPDDPGDIEDTSSYLNVSINILKWAKHTQNVDL